VQPIKLAKAVLAVKGFSASQLPRLYFKSAICTALFRIRGVQSPVVSCDGRLPKLYTKGQINIGERFGMRGAILSCELGAAQKKARLDIGDRVFINQGAIIVAYSHIEIGDDTRIGEFSAVYDTNHHSLDPIHPTKFDSVVIGANVWLCRGVVVLPGSKIGDHTVVAAGSVVKGDLPPRVLAAGNPAQVVRELDVPDGWVRH
jgi:acetyltransferase-like isoleucine patch superfamily enzyme